VFANALATPAPITASKGAKSAKPIVNAEARKGYMAKANPTDRQARERSEGDPIAAALKILHALCDSADDGGYPDLADFEWPPFAPGRREQSTISMASSTKPMARRLAGGASPPCREKHCCRAYIVQ